MAIMRSWSRVKKDPKAALRRAETEPVRITSNGVPTHVSISAEEYRRLIAQSQDEEGEGVSKSLGG
jgi:prevent-host-death family protein